MISAVEATGLGKRYRGALTDALDGLTFSIDQGEIIGLLGPNGAGKTTLMKLLCGIIPPSRGSVTVLGRVPATEGVALKSLVGIVHQRPTFDMFLSADDNLAIFAAFNGLGWREIKPTADSLLGTFQLSRRRSAPVFTLSGGEQRRLQVVRALLKRPRLLLLDEPSAGLDVSSRRGVWSMLRTLREETGTTIIWTSHYVEELERNCDRVMVVNRGRIVRFETPGALVEGWCDQQLVMRFSRPVDLSRLELMLRGDHCRFTLGGDRVEVTGTDVRDKIPALLSALGSDSAALAEMKISSGTLEDAFLSLLDEDAAR